MTYPVTRRRVLSLLAGAPLAGIAPLSAKANTVGEHHWQGRALGAEVFITLHHSDSRAARRVLGRAVAEIDRLENLFSLYRPWSAVSQLNRVGSLARPDDELVYLLREAERFRHLTEGAFNIAVQPLWLLHQAYRGHPPGAELQRARALAEGEIRISEDEIRFDRPGMAITLNGIAQGYISEGVANLLKAEGFDRVLVNLGEFQANGPNGLGRPWAIGLGDQVLDLSEGAIATSSPGGTLFSDDPRDHHLLDGRSGRPGPLVWRSMTVASKSATVADALSTGLALSASPPSRETLKRAGASKAWGVREGGLGLSIVEAEG
ncbi:MAG: FAD:protein FMN transferase [Magnetovibrionaceae bacterium]